MNFFNENFSNYTEKISIGNTIENRNISLLKISLNSRYIKNESKKSAILFTGMHHSREPASMLMNLYLIIYFLSGYEKNNSIITELINNCEMFFIPIVNVDGYVKNNKIYEKSGILDKCMQRKNLNRGSRSVFCNKETDYGVDLNRNYGFKFNYDQEGASNHPCDEDYRGPSAFSEPETQAIKDFIESESGKKIKFAFNYHSFGNILIMPFNFDDANSKELALNYTQQYHVYNDFIEEGHFPDRFTYGNGKKTVE
jgi:murein tripeptide amidase MpaA